MFQYTGGSAYKEIKLPLLYLAARKQDPLCGYIKFQVLQEISVTDTCLTHRYNSITFGSETQYLPKEDVSRTAYGWKTYNRTLDCLWIGIVHFPSLKQLKRNYKLPNERRDAERASRARAPERERQKERKLQTLTERLEKPTMTKRTKRYLAAVDVDDDLPERHGTTEAQIFLRA